MSSSRGNRVVIYWDTSLFISFLTRDDPARVQEVTDAIREAQLPDSSFTITLSQYIRAELPPHPNDDPAQRAIIDQLFLALRPSLGIRYYAVTRAIATKAADIIGQHPQITPPDAIHVATAVLSGASQFWTHDGVTKAGHRRSGKLIGYSGMIDGLVICAPTPLGAFPLFRPRPPSGMPGTP